MKTKQLPFILALFAMLTIVSCSPKARVGTLRTESQSVELEGTAPVKVELIFGAGNLQVAGGAEKLLQADFSYNVDEIKPEVDFKNDTLIVRQPDSVGLPDLRGITDFRNDWRLHLSDQVPMDLSIDAGAGVSELELAGLWLTGFGASFGAGEHTIDLSGDWARDLDIKIDAGAALLTLRLPADVGVSVKIESGPHTIKATGLSKDGDVYTNAAYGVSDVTLRIDLEVGIGQINLEVE